MKKILNSVIVIIYSFISNINGTMTTLKIHLATGFSLPAIFSKVYAINACKVESAAINKAANATVPHKQIKKIKSLNKK